jgi:hypothetical protein
MPAHNTLRILMRNVMVHIFSPLAGHARSIGGPVTGLILLAALLLTGCASVPPPDSAMNAAQGQLQAARDAQAADYAPVDLGFAQDKFQQAQAAMAQRDYEDAGKLAEEARADAELARAKARLASARAQMQSKLAENNALRAEGSHIGTDAATAPGTAPAGTRLPAEQPQDMPAPPASMLAPPPTDGGFQTVPEPSQSGNAGTPPPAEEQP